MAPPLKTVISAAMEVTAKGGDEGKNDESRRSHDGKTRRELKDATHRAVYYVNVS
jgi:hypothetical protein